MPSDEMHIPHTLSITEVSFQKSPVGKDSAEVRIEASQSQL